MTRTVDLVIVGSGPAAAALAVAAAGRGRRVLIVTGAKRARFGRHVQRLVRGKSKGGQRIVVLTGCELVCADGIERLEAVVIRRITSGRLVEFNASALVYGINRPPWIEEHEMKLSSRHFRDRQGRLTRGSR